MFVVLFHCSDIFIYGTIKAKEHMTHTQRSPMSCSKSKLNLEFSYKMALLRTSRRLVLRHTLIHLSINKEVQTTAEDIDSFD